MSSDHDSPIKTPKQLITVIGLSFIVPIIIIVLLVSYVNSQSRVGSGTEAAAAKAIEQRIKPIAGFEIRDASAPRILRTGEEVYKAQCTACHAAGVAGSPKFGDTAAWSARIKTGYEALLTSALKGKGAMAAQAGGEYSDDEIGRAVVYLANAAGGKLADVVVKVATPAAAATTPAAPSAVAPAAPTK